MSGSSAGVVGHGRPPLKRHLMIDEGLADAEPTVEPCPTCRGANCSPQYCRILGTVIGPDDTSISHLPRRCPDCGSRNCIGRVDGESCENTEPPLLSRLPEQALRRQYT